MTPEISLIVPAFNEAEIIVRTVEELNAYMRQHMPGREFELVVIDDGSRDGTAQLLSGMPISELRVIRHPYNRGRGAAIRTGFAASKGKYVVSLDADLSYAPTHIPLLLAPIETNEADIVLASAYHPKGAVRNVPFMRAKLSYYGNKVLRAGVRRQLHTLTCMVRAYRREVINSLELISEGKDLHIEIIQKANMFGYRITEIPATLDWRQKAREKRLGKAWRFPLMASSSTIASHLVYNYVLRPGSMLFVPVLLLGLTVLAGVVSLAYGWAENSVALLNHGIFIAVYQGLRNTLIAGALTLTIMGGSAFILMVFLAFYFQSHQNKKQFEELYILLARANDRLKHLEKTRTD